MVTFYGYVTRGCVLLCLVVTPNFNHQFSITQCLIPASPIENALSSLQRWHLASTPAFPVLVALSAGLQAEWKYGEVCLTLAQRSGT
eukprot:s1145_g6.t1